MKQGPGYTAGGRVGWIQACSVPLQKFLKYVAYEIVKKRKFNLPESLVSFSIFYRYIFLIIWRNSILHFRFFLSVNIHLKIYIYLLPQKLWSKLNRCSVFLQFFEAQASLLEVIAYLRLSLSFQFKRTEYSDGTKSHRQQHYHLKRNHERKKMYSIVAFLFFHIFPEFLY